MILTTVLVTLAGLGRIASECLCTGRESVCCYCETLVSVRQNVYILYVYRLCVYRDEDCMGSNSMLLLPLSVFVIHGHRSCEKGIRGAYGLLSLADAIPILTFVLAVKSSMLKCLMQKPYWQENLIDFNRLGLYCDSLVDTASLTKNCSFMSNAFPFRDKLLLSEVFYLYNEQNQYRGRAQARAQYFKHTRSCLLIIIIHRSTFPQSRDRKAQHEEKNSTEQPL